MKESSDDKTFLENHQGEDKSGLSDWGDTLCLATLIVSSLVVTSLKLVFPVDRGTPVVENKRRTKRGTKGEKEGIGGINFASVASSYCYSTATHTLKAFLRTVGKLPSVSGAVVVFRKTAEIEDKDCEIPYSSTDCIMEDLCGLIQKQGNFWGAWKDRYIRVARLDSEEWGHFKQYKKKFRQDAKTAQNYFLFYWACSEKEAKSDDIKYSPRGAFGLGGCSVELGATDDVIILDKLYDAMYPKSIAPAIYLRAPNVVAAKKWVSAFSFASVAPLFVEEKSASSIRPYPLPVACDTLRFSYAKNGSSSRKAYFRLYRAFDSLEQAVKVKGEIGGAEKAEKVYLMSWASEEAAACNPVCPENIYDLSSANVLVSNKHQDTVVVENGSNFMCSNTVPIGSICSLKAPSVGAAVAWAKEISESCTISFSPAAVIPPGMGSGSAVATISKGETVVDELTLSNHFIAKSDSDQDSDGGGGRGGEQVVDELSVMDILALDINADDGYLSDGDQEEDMAHSPETAYLLSSVEYDESMFNDPSMENSSLASNTFTSQQQPRRSKPKPALSPVREERRGSVGFFFGGGPR